MFPINRNQSEFKTRNHEKNIRSVVNSRQNEIIHQREESVKNSINEVRKSRKYVSQAKETDEFGEAIMDSARFDEFEENVGDDR